MSRIAKIIQLVCIFFVLAFVGISFPSKVQAQGCMIYTTLNCYNVNGVEVCSYEYYDGCGGNEDYCPPNHYRAPDGSCRENGASCPCGEFYACPTANNPGKQCACCPAEEACRSGKVDCPPGTTRGTTVVGTLCSLVDSVPLCGGVGSAQVSAGSNATGANCCRGVNFETDNCWTKPSGVVECETEWFCTNPRITTYNCVSTCNATAPTNVSVTQGASATSANIAWTSGTNGVSHKIYVGTDQAKVNANCPLNDCHVNGTTLSPFYASSSYTYPVTGLTPGTPYYFRVVTYKDSTCLPGTTTPYTTPAANVISGNVYLDTNNTCSTVTRLTTPGMTATIQGTGYSGAVTNGVFSFTAGEATSYANLQLSGVPEGYSCSTATGCNECLNLSVASSSYANNFFLTPQREPWWQAVGVIDYANVGLDKA